MPRIDRRRLTNFYVSFSAHASLQRVKLPSLQEFLSLNSNSEGAQSFDDKSDEYLTKMAERRLKELHTNYVRTPDKDKC